MRNYLIAIVCGFAALLLIDARALAQPADAGVTSSGSNELVGFQTLGVAQSVAIGVPDAVAADLTAGKAHLEVVAGPKTETSGKVVLPTTTQLTADAENPARALSDVQLTRKSGWPFMVWAIVTMIGKGLAYGRERLKSAPLGIGKLAMWLAVGKRVMIVSAISAFGSAGYDVLLGGGTVTAALMASGFAVAGIVSSTTRSTPGAPVVPVKP